jgi:hypothetical protein
LLELDRDVTYTDEIHPICLPITPDARTRNLTNTNPFVGGWGTVQFSEFVHANQLFISLYIFFFLFKN